MSTSPPHQATPSTRCRCTTVCTIVLHLRHGMAVQGLHQVKGNAAWVGALQRLGVSSQGIREIVVQFRIRLLDVCQRLPLRYGTQGRQQYITAQKQQHQGRQGTVKGGDQWHVWDELLDAQPKQ